MAHLKKFRDLVQVPYHPVLEVGGLYYKLTVFC